MPARAEWWVGRGSGMYVCMCMYRCVRVCVFVLMCTCVYVCVRGVASQQCATLTSLVSMVAFGGEVGSDAGLNWEGESECGRVYMWENTSILLTLLPHLPQKRAI